MKNSFILLLVLAFTAPAVAQEKTIHDYANEKIAEWKAKGAQLIYNETVNSMGATAKFNGTEGYEYVVIVITPKEVTSLSMSVRGFDNEVEFPLRKSSAQITGYPLDCPVSGKYMVNVYVSSGFKTVDYRVLIFRN